MLWPLNLLPATSGVVGSDCGAPRSHSAQTFHPQMLVPGALQAIARDSSGQTAFSPGGPRLVQGVWFPEQRSDYRTNRPLRAPSMRESLIAISLTGPNCSNTCRVSWSN
jgi:hypothetical protein